MSDEADTTEAQASLIEEVDPSVGLYTAIARKDKVAVLAYLDRLDLDDPSTTEEEWTGFSNELLEALADAGAYEIAPAVVEILRKSDLLAGFIDLLSRIYLWPIMKLSTLGFLAKAFPGYDFMLHMSNLIEAAPDNQDMVLACSRLENIYLVGELASSDPENLRQLANTLARLLDEASTHEKSYAVKFLRTQLSRARQPAPVPAWVKNFHGGELQVNYPIEAPEEYEFILPNVKEAGDFYMEYDQGIRNTDTAFDQTLRTAFELMYANASEEDKRRMMVPYVKAEYYLSLGRRIDYFRLLGPSHPITGKKLDDLDHPCIKYGFCRMLVCLHGETYDDMDEPGTPADWFQKVCDNCEKTIDNRARAMRALRERGGWTGCYCSTACVKEDWDSRDGDDVPIPIMYDALNEVEKDLNKYGIQDRLDGPPILPWPSDEININPLDYAVGLILTRGSAASVVL